MGPGVLGVPDLLLECRVEIFPAPAFGHFLPLGLTCFTWTMELILKLKEATHEIGVHVARCLAPCDGY